MTSSTLQSRKWQLIGMNQLCRSALCGHPLPALTDNWTLGAASRHTIAPISHTRASPRSRSYYSFPVPLRVGGWVGLSTQYVSNLLKVACSGPGVSRTLNLLVTSPILYQLDHCTRTHDKAKSCHIVLNWYMRHIEQQRVEYWKSFFRRFVRKASTWLGQHYHRGVSLEVIPLAYIPVMNKVQTMFGGSVVLRMAKNKAVCYAYRWLFYCCACYCFYAFLCFTFLKISTFLPMTYLGYQ